jgi:hypothetical protein
MIDGSLLDLLKGLHETLAQDIGVDISLLSHHFHLNSAHIDHNEHRE